ncbi:MAG TPA: DUF1854 domain-containing protein, partial [Candidatus Latescibacteria bacterium]|nr:DUF1854 domain-containing protein [Candidatus Latescibacterota bacterium]
MEESTTQKPTESGYKGLVFLDPKDITIHESELAGMNVTVGGETFEEVRASLALPITEPDRYVSLRIGASKGEEQEIGMIRDVNELSPENQALVRRELRKRYFLHV